MGDAPPPEPAGAGPGPSSAGPSWSMPAAHAGLRLASHTPLAEAAAATGRSTCPRCQRSRFLYCYDCLLPLTDGVPRVELPFQLSVITHGEEHRSKNTGVHLAILAPGHVRLHAVGEPPGGLPDRPPYDSAMAAVLFPSDDAVPADEVEPGSLAHVFVIDSRWKKAPALLKHPSLAGLRRVKLAETAPRTAFWRRKTMGAPDEGVCTAEAVLFLCRDMHEGAARRAREAQEAGAAGAPGAAGAAGPEPCITWTAIDPIERADAMTASRAGPPQAEEAPVGSAAAAGAPPSEAPGCHCYDDLLW